MENVMQLPQYVFFDLSGTELRCFSSTPAAELIGTQVLGLEALHRTRLSRTFDRVGTMLCDHSQGEFESDTVSDAGTSGVRVAEEGGEDADDESEDEIEGSLDEVLYEESFGTKIKALTELVGMKGPYEPAAVLGEVVRVLKEMEWKREHFVGATRVVRS